jgi:hypothetical protein
MGNAFATPRPAATRNGWTVSGTWYPMRNCAAIERGTGQAGTFGRVNIVRNNDGASGADKYFCRIGAV